MSPFPSERRPQPPLFVSVPRQPDDADRPHAHLVPTRLGHTTSHHGDKAARLSGCSPQRLHRLDAMGTACTEPLCRSLNLKQLNQKHIPSFPASQDSQALHNVMSSLAACEPLEKRSLMFINCSSVALLSFPRPCCIQMPTGIDLRTGRSRGRMGAGGVSRGREGLGSLEGGRQVTG